MVKRFFCLIFVFIILSSVSLPVFAGGSTGVPGEESSHGDDDDKPKTSDSDVTGTDVTGTDVTGTDVTGTDVSSSDVSKTDLSKPKKPYGEMRGLTTAEYIADMKAGYSLGHSLDSWAQDAGYDDYYNCNAYAVQILYEDYNPNPETDPKKSKTKEVETVNTLTVSQKVQFKKDGTCKIEWNTGNIMTPATRSVGNLGFFVSYSSTIDKPLDVVVNVKKASYKRRNGGTFNFKSLLGEQVVTIYPSNSEYASVARCTTSDFPTGIRRTMGINDGTFTLEVELVDYIQKNYNKEQYFEALWNNPITTQSVIDQIKKEGYNSVRLPVTYFNHINPETGEIDKAWLSRVEQVAGYILHNDMYCMINMQNDSATSGWLRVDLGKEAEIKKKYSDLWRQIAERFKPYGDRLIFEGYSVLTDPDETWGYPGKEKMAWMNDLSQRFVDAVRGTGGNNADRLLLITPYAASNDEKILRELKLPKDTADNRVVVSLHAFEPAEFSLEVGEADTWGSAEDKQKLGEFFSRIHDIFVSKGIPVIISEFGSVAKESAGQGSTYKEDVSGGDVSGGDTGESQEEAAEPAPELTEEDLLNKPEVKLNTADRVLHAQYYAERARDMGIACFWWDDGKFFDRQTFTWEFPEISEAMVNVSGIHVSNLTIGDIKPQTASQDLLESVTPPITVQYGDQKLTEGEDYTLHYAENYAPGNGVVSIVGRGKYVGVTTREFVINPPKASIAGILPSLSGDKAEDLSVLAFSMPILVIAAFVYYMQHQQRVREARRLALVREGTLEAKREMAELSGMSYEEYDNYDDYGDHLSVGYNDDDDFDDDDVFDDEDDLNGFDDMGGFAQDSGFDDF